MSKTEPEWINGLPFYTLPNGKRSDGVGMNIKEPYINDFCKKCTFYYLRNGEELMCSVITLGMGDVTCERVRECYKFKLK